ncbi:hypothetical protein DFS33DRAFT_809227 [Desarmillaria ectypa]|nr:hypothetical protein DFS33DRAFT_809227 [Desarmillaria ectypa]
MWGYLGDVSRPLALSRQQDSFVKGLRGIIKNLVYEMTSNIKFDFGERLGIFLIVEAASLFALSVATLLVYVGFKLFKRVQARRALRKHSMDADRWDASNPVYFISLMCAELIQALGGLLNIQWIIDAGTLCTAQGILKQMGDVTVALTPSQSIRSTSSSCVGGHLPGCPLLSSPSFGSSPP